MAAIDGVHDANVGAEPTTNVDASSALPADPTPAQRRAVRRLHEAMEAFEAQLQCPICLCAYTAPASLPCNHCFCEECIHRALELKQVCPICKAPAKKRSLRHDTMIQQLQQAAELWVSVPSAVPIGDYEEPAIQAPVRINRLAMAAASPTSSSASSVETPSRRRKRKSTVLANGDGNAGVVSVPTRVDRKRPLQADDRDSEERSDDEVESKESTPDRTQLERLPSPAKRRVVASNGVGRPAPATNGHSVQASENGSVPAPAAFTVGDLVEVVDRTWRGINKPGGAAWITSANRDGTYDVKYIIGTGRESNIPDQYILTPREEIGSLATPGRAVKQNRRRSTKLVTPPSVDLLGGHGVSFMGKMKRSDLVFLFSGYTDDELDQLKPYADALGAQVVDNWSHFVTHLIAKCATAKEVAASLAEDDHYNGISSASVGGGIHARKRSLFKEELHKRWVKIRSMKYLKALVAGRWIVSEEWLRDCAQQKRRLAEANYEADGHLKAQSVVAACQRSRTMREETLRMISPEEVNPLSVGTRLFADFCFHIYGEFLPPMPPPAELSTLIAIGGGRNIHFLDDIAMEMDKPQNRDKTLVIVSDKLNQQMLRRLTKELTVLPQLQGVVNKEVVSYQWILNSISEAKLRAFI